MSLSESFSFQEVSTALFVNLNHYLLEAKRQNIALELLESERKYVINLSLILKIKATLQGPDVKRSTKERRYWI